MKTAFLAAAAAGALLITACSPAPEPAPAPMPAEEADTDLLPEVSEEDDGELYTAYEIVASTPDLSTFSAAAAASGLAEDLAGEGPITLFVPSNAAFAALPAGTLDQLLLPENKAKLARIVGYHAVPGTIRSADVPAADAGQATASLNGLDLSVRVDPDGAVKVNQATVTQADIAASNGVIHIIDTVLMPRMEE